tara:strand:- start:3765 stop:4286 length:522 start_codon:yes stop_codon:yes gene_type:complete
MSVREIVLMGDPVLRAEAEFVEDFDERLVALVQDMFETMYHAEGIGLAAPQVGISTGVIVVDLRREDEDDQPLAIVNPSITWHSKKTHKKPEGCLSIPGLEEVVERFTAVRVEGFDPDGNAISVEADDLLARALQHEIDHIHGVLFLDHLSPLKRRMLLKKWKKLEADGFEEP